MRVIEAKLGEVRAVAVSPDGRFVAACGIEALGVFHWATGEPVPGARSTGTAEQVVFAPGSDWFVRALRGALCPEGVERLPPELPDRGLRFAGGVAVSPDGKTLVATTHALLNTTGIPTNQAKLARWMLTSPPLATKFDLRWTPLILRSILGFDDWPPFNRLAFSPNGEFLAGISSSGFELRFGRTGGIDYRHRMPRGTRFTVPGFVSFDRDSGTCAFGWADEFHLLGISTGTSKSGPRIEASFRDAAFLPSGRHFATVGDDGRLKLWDPRTWKVVREYDWDCAALTALAFSADGSAGVCGTADGRLVQFDVDE